jgi:hypothetical protein
VELLSQRVVSAALAALAAKVEAPHQIDMEATLPVVEEAVDVRQTGEMEQVEVMTVQEAECRLPSIALAEAPIIPDGGAAVAAAA